MNASDHPMFKILIAGLVAAVITARFAWRSRSFFGRMFLILLTLGFLVPSGILAVGMNPWLIDARYRTYREFYWSIRRGMSREEVLALMNRIYPPGDPLLRPIIMEDSASRLGFYMNPGDKTEPNQEAILVKMDDGRVVGVDYSPDRSE